MNQAVYVLTLNGGLAAALLALGCTPPPSVAAASREHKAAESKLQPTAAPPSDQDDIDDLIKQLEGNLPKPTKGVAKQTSPDKPETLQRIQKLGSEGLDDIDDLIKQLGGKVPEPNLDVDDTKVPAIELSRPAQARQDAAGSEPKTSPTPARVLLPQYFDQLDLTDEEKQQMSRVAQRYDAKIAELKRKLDAARQVPIGTAGVIMGWANAIKKLINQRQEALEEILTEEQRNQLRQLRAGK